MLDQIAPEMLVAPEEAQSRGVPARCGGTLARALGRLEELDLAQAVVARALLSELGRSKGADAGRPLEQTVVVTADGLRGYDAVGRLSAGVENADAFLRHQVAALRDVTFWASAHAAGQASGALHYDEVTLFNIVEIREWSDDRKAVDPGADGSAFHWLVRGGLWAGSHLGGACRRALCRIARASLDPVRDSAALLVLRLGSIAMARSCPGTAQPEMVTTVGDLLAAMGRLPVEQLRTAEWGRRTAADLSDASGALRRAGVFRNAETPGLPPDGGLGVGAIGGWLNAEATFAFDVDAQ